jgi:hypothetical protein
MTTSHGVLLDDFVRLGELPGDVVAHRLDGSIWAAMPAMFSWIVESPFPSLRQTVVFSEHIACASVHSLFSRLRRYVKTVGTRWWRESDTWLKSTVRVLPGSTRG